MRVGVSLGLAVSLATMSSGVSGASSSVVKNSAYGFTFALPDHWQSVPLSGGDISGILDLMTKADPGLAGSLTTQVKRAVKQGIKVFVVGPISHHFASNINILAAPQSVGPSTSGYFDEIGVAVKVNLASSGMKNVVTSVVHWPQGRVLQVTYSFHLVVPHLLVEGLQDYVWHKGRIFVVTFSSTAMSTDRSIARVVGHSWRWT